MPPNAGLREVDSPRKVDLQDVQSIARRIQLHVPDVGSACGGSDGKLQRLLPRFQEVMPNLNHSAVLQDARVGRVDHEVRGPSIFGSQRDLIRKRTIPSSHQTEQNRLLAPEEILFQDAHAHRRAVQERADAIQLLFEDRDCPHALQESLAIGSVRYQLRATLLVSRERAAEREVAQQRGIELSHALRLDLAHLAYLENDEALTESGAAARWGYLFFAPSRDAARAYSVEDGKIIQAFDLTVRFDAPPISNRWIDSQAALAAAHQEMGREREQYGSVPSTMLLMRGAFDEKEPDRTCWLVCFRAQALPSLYIVVDASTGSIVRNWRG